MNEVEYNLDTIRVFYSNINGSLDTLIDIVKKMENETELFKENGQSKTLTLFNDFVENELNIQVKYLGSKKIKYSELFNGEIIPLYEELYNQTEESVGK